MGKAHMKTRKDGRSYLGSFPHQGLDLGLQMQAFYNGVSYGAKQLIDTSADGSTDAKTPKQVYDLIE